MLNLKLKFTYHFLIMFPPIFTRRRNVNKFFVLDKFIKLEVYVFKGSLLLFYYIEKLALTYIPYIQM